MAIDGFDILKLANISISDASKTLNNALDDAEKMYKEQNKNQQQSLAQFQKLLDEQKNEAKVALITAFQKDMEKAFNSQDPNQAEQYIGVATTELANKLKELGDDNSAIKLLQNLDTIKKQAKYNVTQKQVEDLYLTQIVPIINNNLDPIERGKLLKQKKAEIYQLLKEQYKNDPETAITAIETFNKLINNNRNEIGYFNRFLVQQREDAIRQQKEQDKLSYDMQLLDQIKSLFSSNSTNQPLINNQEQNPINKTNNNSSVLDNILQQNPTANQSVSTIGNKNITSDEQTKKAKILTLIDKINEKIKKTTNIFLENQGEYNTKTSKTPEMINNALNSLIQTLDKAGYNDKAEFLNKLKNTLISEGQYDAKGKLFFNDYDFSNDRDKEQLINYLGLNPDSKYAQIIKNSNNPAEAIAKISQTIVNEYKFEDFYGTDKMSNGTENIVSFVSNHSDLRDLSKKVNSAYNILNNIKDLNPQLMEKVYEITPLLKTATGRRMLSSTIKMYDLNTQNKIKNMTQQLNDFSNKIGTKIIQLADKHPDVKAYIITAFNEAKQGDYTKLVKLITGKSDDIDIKPEDIQIAQLTFNTLINNKNFAKKVDKFSKEFTIRQIFGIPTKVDYDLRENRLSINNPALWGTTKMLNRLNNDYWNNIDVDDFISSNNSVEKGFYKFKNIVKHNSALQKIINSLGSDENYDYNLKKFYLLYLANNTMLHNNDMLSTLKSTTLKDVEKTYGNLNEKITALLEKIKSGDYVINKNFQLIKRPH